MRPCLEDEELFALVDDALAEKDAVLLRAHIAGCARCDRSAKRLERGLACLAEEEPLDASRHADAVLAAIDRPQPARPSRPWRRALALPIGALVAAAAVMIGINVGHQRSADEGFTARGGLPDDASLRRGVAVTLQTLDDDVARPLTAGSVVTRRTRFVASHRSTGRELAYALVFGVDAAGAVHWLYPAYESAATDPSSVPLGPTEGREVLMGTAVSFEDVHAGRLSIVTILSREPYHVSRVEGRDARQLEALRRDFSEADFTSIDVLVAEP